MLAKDRPTSSWRELLVHIVCLHEKSLCELKNDESVTQLIQSPFRHGRQLPEPPGRDGCCSLMIPSRFRHFAVIVASDSIVVESDMRTRWKRYVIHCIEKSFLTARNDIDGICLSRHLTILKTCFS